MCADKYQERTVYVIGAGGFIGTHLVKSIEGAQGLSCSAGGLSSVTQVKNYWEAIPEYADFIIHVAEPALVTIEAGFDEEKYKSERLSLVKNLLALKPKHLIYFSSALVGKRDSAYTCSKLAVENLLTDCASSIIIRLGNLYGLGMSSSNIISEVIAQIKQGADPVLIKKANVSTSYMHVSDLVSLVLKIIDKPKSGIYYAAGTELISAIELARKIITVFGDGSGSVVAQDYEDKSAIVSDISSTQMTFAWSPQVDISTGLEMLKKELEVRS